MAKNPHHAKLEILFQANGMTLADCLSFYDSKATERDKEIAAMVDTNDELECDNALLSDSGPDGDNGSWVLVWVWVDFAGTKFDKYPEGRS